VKWIKIGGQISQFRNANVCENLKIPKNGPKQQENAASKEFPTDN
jgi:hypothetical protein